MLKISTYSAFLMLFALTAIACGDTATEDKQPTIIINEDMSDTDMPVDMADMSDVDMANNEVTSGCGETGVAFQVYSDNDRSSLTGYGQFIKDPDAPVTSLKVELITKDAPLSGETCDDGTIAWSNLPDGPYLLSLPMNTEQYVTSSNQSRRLPKAIKEGTVNILTFGDSIPAYGPRPWFPSKLADTIKPLAQVNNNNVAVPGSQSTEWLPTTRYYRTKLQPSIATADVIVFSLGGNDLYNFAMSLGTLSQDKINAKYAEFQELVDEIKVNLRVLVKDIRQQNPDADIVWILYPNYAHSTYWADLAGTSINLVQNLLQRTLIDVRNDIGTQEDLLIVDMLNAMYKRDLNQFLIDPLHLNQPGHDFYAQEVFKTLGGVMVQNGEVVQETGARKIGLAARP